MGKLLTCCLAFLLSAPVQNPGPSLTGALASSGFAGPTIRGTTAFFVGSTTNPENITLPAGAVAGDFYIVQASGDNGVSNCSSGSTTLYADSLQSYINGFACSNTVTSTDVTNGYIQINPGSNSDLIVLLTVFVGTHTVQNTYHVQSGTGSFTSPVAGPAEKVTAPVVSLYAGMNRTTGGSTNSVDRGTSQKVGQTPDGTLAGALYSENISSSGTYTPNFSFQLPVTGTPLAL